MELQPGSTTSAPLTEVVDIWGDVEADLETPELTTLDWLDESELTDLQDFVNLGDADAESPLDLELDRSLEPLTEGADQSEVERSPVNEPEATAAVMPELPVIPATMPSADRETMSAQRMAVRTSFSSLPPCHRQREKRCPHSHPLS